MDDSTPTFSSHIQSRRLRRAVEELYIPEATKTKTNDLQDETVISLVEMKSEDTVKPTSEQDEVSLEERVEALEKKIADMTTTLTSLGEAFSDLQTQVSIFLKMKNRTELFYSVRNCRMNRKLSHHGRVLKQPTVLYHGYLKF